MARAKLTDELSGDNSLLFPQDMDQQFYPESIKFGIYERQGVSYSALKKKVGESTDKLVKFFNSSSGGTGGGTGISELIEKGEAIVANISTSIGTKSVQNTNNVGASTDSTSSSSSSKLQKNKSVEKHLKSIYLNMPSSVVFNESVGWQGADLGVIGALKTGNMKAALENGLLSNAGAILGGGALALGGGIAGGIIGSVLGGGALQSGIESTFNVKANPYKEQTFQGVDFRSFDFTFTLRARSQTDVNLIQKIIRAFRQYSKPTFETSSDHSVFSYPKEFRIEFLTIDGNNSYITNKYLPEIKYCVCTSVNTNFSGTGWRSFEDGAPVDVSLQLTFQETEIITGEDVIGSTDVGRFKAPSDGAGRMF